jgi:hypothetical protein
LPVLWPAAARVAPSAERVAGRAAFLAEPVADRDAFAADPVAGLEVFFAEPEPVADRDVFFADPAAGRDVFFAAPVAGRDVFFAAPVAGRDVFFAAPLDDARERPEVFGELPLDFPSDPLLVCRPRVARPVDDPPADFEDERPFNRARLVAPRSLSTAMSTSLFELGVPYLGRP